MKITSFYSDNCIRYNDTLKDFCKNNNIELTSYNADSDPLILSDFGLTGNPPVFIMFDDDDVRKLTHYGKFTYEKLSDILKV